MYDKIKVRLEAEFDGMTLDPRIIQEIVGWFEDLGAQDPSDEQLWEAVVVYNYLASGRTIFGSGR